MNKKMVVVSLAAVAIAALGSLGVAYATSDSGRLFGGSSKAGVACSSGQNAGAGCQMQGGQGGTCSMGASDTDAAQNSGCPMGNAGSTQGSGGCCSAN